MDLYQILGVSLDADEDTIKKAYRKAVKECHPDTHPGDKAAEEKFKRLATAYSILGDKEKRKQYDEEKRQKKHFKESANKKSNCENSINPANFENMFEHFFSMGDSGKNNNSDKYKKNPIDVTDMFERYMGFKM